MSEKRRDKKGRILQNGESQRKDGRYAYKYIDNFGKPKFLYAWKLTPLDKLPKGKREDLSLREKEEALQKDLFDGIDSTGKKMTVCDLYEKYIRIHSNVRDNTKVGRERLLKSLKEDKLGVCAIENVKPSDAKEWAIRMKLKGTPYQVIKNDQRSLKAIFYMAIEDDCIRKNPFKFKLKDIIDDDTESRVPLTPLQEHNLLEFMKNSKIYYKYVDDIIVFLETGLRASELCGLTETDLDFTNREINIDHQLLKNKQGYYIETPKTDAGVRKVPMSDKCFQALKRIIANRKNIKSIVIDEYSNFVFLNRNGLPRIARDYANVFRGLVSKYNECHTESLPHKTTPHSLRHTFCTKMANSGMNPKALQYIMGHSNILITLSYYAHVNSESAKIEMERVLKSEIYYFFTTFESENIRNYENICENLPKQEKPQTLVKPSYSGI